MSRKRLLQVSIVTLGALALATPALAQEPPSGPQPDWHAMPTVAPTGKPDDPMRDYYNATLIGETYPLWAFHIWYNPDGTHMMFYAHHYPDGTWRMGSAQRYWRLVGSPGKYGLCMRTEADPNSHETCGPFEFNHLGEVFYQDYDRQASGDIPTYNNAHEVLAFVKGKR